MYTRLPMFSRIGADAIKVDITNTVLLCERIGNPHLTFKSVHIAGTNGKGSVSHMLAAIFQTAGYKTGLYTSPHLKDFRERIKIDGHMVEEDFVLEFIEHIQPAIEELSPSFFEITVAMAFSYFARQKVDIAIIETGLGGRLDSTNIITPELSVITNIGWDHMNILGDSLQKIASEKAGIIKRGVPAVVGQQDDETRAVFEEKASAEQAPLLFADAKRRVTGWTYEKPLLVTEVTKLHSDDKHYYHLDLPGIYQTKNLVTVLEAVSVLKRGGWIIEEQQVEKALRQVKRLTGLHGRWETIREHPAIIADVAHNAAGMREVVAQLEVMTYRKLYIIMGMVKDKEIDKVLELLPKDAQYFFTRAQIERALPEAELADAGSRHGLKGHPYPDVNTAIRAALAQAGKEDTLLVCGSVFVIGEIDAERF